MIDELKKSGKWKIQLPMTVYFISSNDNDDKQLIYLKNDNIKSRSAVSQMKLLKNFFNYCLLNINQA